MTSTLNKHTGYFATFSSATSSYRVVIEDDGRVCYAYLLDGDGHICSDVWLYNRVDTPDHVEWNNLCDAPFLNPREFIRSDIKVVTPDSPNGFSVEFKDSSSQAEIYFEGIIMARLQKGYKPGWSAFAKKNGPLAQVLAQ